MLWLFRGVWMVPMAGWRRRAAILTGLRCGREAGDGGEPGGPGAGWGRRVAMLAGLGCGREPGVAGEQAGQGVEGLDAPFGGGGQVGADDGEVGEAEQGAPGAAGGVLGDLDRADVAFGLVGSESDGQVGGEAED